MGNAIPLMVGLFAGTYLNNPKFRTQVETGIQSILGQGIDYLNKMDGDANVPNQSLSDEPNE